MHGNRARRLMATKRHRLIPQPFATSVSFKRDFKELFALTAEQIDKLAAAADTERGFDLPDESIEDMSKRMGVDSLKLAAVVQVLDFLYGHARASDIDSEEATRQVCDFAKKLDVGDYEAKIPAIKRLFEPKEAYNRRMMVEISSSAVVPTLSEVTSVCDMRTVIDTTTGKIAGYVPIALIGMRLKDGDRSRKISLQVSEEDIDKLLEELNKAKNLLITLGREFAGRVLGARPDSL